jgi:DNA-binding MarR family transcriptional regulator
VEKIESVVFYTLDKGIKTYRQFAQTRLNEASLGITVDQWLIMNVVNEDPELSQQEIAEKVFKDNASVTRIIELLVQKGYMKRDVSKNDGRRTSLSISAKGRNLMYKAEKVVRSYRKTALRSISERDLNSLNKIVNKIIDNCNT